VQERKDIQAQILQASEISSSTSDIKRIARQILNRCIAKKLISKQEVMVQLSGLPLTTCTEIVETVSLSGFRKLSNTSSKTFLSSYAKRPTQFHNNSLHEYFHIKKNNH